MYTTGMVGVVWAKLISKYTKTIMMLYQRHAQRNDEVLTRVKSRTGIHCRAVNSKQRLNIQRPVHLLIGVPPSCHFKLAWMLLYLSICAGCVWAVTVPPVVFQCRLQRLEFLQWHPSVGQIQLRFSSGIPMWGCFNHFFFPLVFQCILQVFAGWPSVHWVNQWHSTGSG